MAKILRKILLFIPILILSTFSIYNVKADEPINIYFRNSLNQFSFTKGNYDYSLLNFNSYTQDFVFNYNYNSSLNDNEFILYNSNTDTYIIFSTYSTSSTCSTSNRTFNIKRTEIQCTGSDYFIYGGFSNYFFTILSDDESKGLSVINSIYSNLSSSDIVKFNSGDYYLIQAPNYRSWTNILKYIFDNRNDFSLISIAHDKLYINSEEVPLYVEPTPPEPPVIEENLDKIFVPNYKEGQCIEILDKDTLRVFENENTNNYIDYYINSHYISKEGQTEVDYTKKCSTREFTSIGYYRNDFPEILFMIGSLSLFSIGFIFILFKRFRKR